MTSAVPAHKEIVSSPTVQCVIASTSEQAIVTFNPGKRVVPGVADECIVTGGAYCI